MSGNIGRGRKWPARFVVVLTRADLAPDATERINLLLASSLETTDLKLGPDGLVLVLPHQNPAAFDGIVSICVSGFSISGDEGGTWTNYRGLSLES
jgi:hypothetical protein